MLAIGLEPIPQKRTDFKSVASTTSAKRAYRVNNGIRTHDLQSHNLTL